MKLLWNSVHANTVGWQKGGQSFVKTYMSGRILEEIWPSFPVNQNSYDNLSTDLISTSLLIKKRKTFTETYAQQVQIFF